MILKNWAFTLEILKEVYISLMQLMDGEINVSFNMKRNSRMFIDLAYSKFLMFKKLVAHFQQDMIRQSEDLIHNKMIR